MTMILVFEIVARFAVDWRSFHRNKRNWVDLGIAVITAIIQIPRIHNSGQPYAWLTFFQILRFYRVVLAVSTTRDLIVSLRSMFVLAGLTVETANRAGKRFRSAQPYSIRVSNHIPHLHLCSPDFPGRNTSRGRR